MKRRWHCGPWISLSAVLGVYFLGRVVMGSAVPGLPAGNEGGLTSKWHPEDGRPDSSAAAKAPTAGVHPSLGTCRESARFDGGGFKTLIGAITPEWPGVAMVDRHFDQQGRIRAGTAAWMAWADLGADGQIGYFDPAPDDCPLRVCESDNAEAGSESGPRPNVKDRTVFWRTWWFRTGLVLAWIGSVAGISWRLSQNRLYAEGEIRKAREQFTQQLILAQERERKKVATELHDCVGQCLVLIRNHALLASSLNQGGDPKAHLESIAELSGSGIDDVRTIAENLHPHQLDKLGLPEAIRSMCRRVGESSSIRFETAIEPINDLHDKSRELNIYRLVQEAINNVLHHSRASQATVTVAREDQGIRISVGDNGCGITGGSLAKNPEGRSGLGFQSMRERLQMLGASMDVKTAKGLGTTLTFWIPLSKNSGLRTHGESSHELN